MKIKLNTNKIIILYIIFINIYIFFSHLSIFTSYVNVNTIFLGVSFIFLGYIFISNLKKITLDRSDLLLILFMIYLLMHCIILKANLEGIKYFMFFSLVGLMTIMMKNITDWYKIMIKAMLVCSFIHCIFIVLQGIFPEFVLQIDRFLLKSDTWELVNYSNGNNYYCGIAPGAASAGLFATVLVGISISKVLVERKITIVNFMFLIIGLIALLLSQKRIFLLALVVALPTLIFVVTRMQKEMKESKKSFMALGGVFLLFLIIVCLIPETQNVINRFFNNNRMLSGRELMYEKMLNWFQQKPVFGTGLGTADAEFGYGGHNIYLQMLAECGIVGAILYFTYLFSFVITNIKLIIKEKIIDYKAIFVMFMQIVLVLYGVTGNPIYDYSYLVLFMYLLTIPRTMKKEQEKIEKSKCDSTSIQ